MKTQPELDSSKICVKSGGKRILSESMADALLQLSIPTMHLSSKYKCGDHWHVTSMSRDENEFRQRKKANRK